MYLTDFREYSLKDVITQFEPRLFKKVTGLTVKDFELLVSIGIFNDSLMNQAVYNFKRYEDASLEYTGINQHKDEEGVGLFSTVISRGDYEDMAASQMSSMMEDPFRKVLVKEDSSRKPVQKKVPTPKQPAPPTKPVAQKPTPVPQNVNPGHSVPGLYPDTSTGAQKPSDAAEYTELDLTELRIGTIVEHLRFGTGKVTGFKPGKMLVSFPEDLKLFPVPFAFEKGYLKVKEW